LSLLKTTGLASRYCSYATWR